MTDWTDERLETCLRLWKEGWSASQIARHIGGATRCAVIAKIHREGGSKRDKPSPPPARPAPRVVHARPAEPRPIYRLAGGGSVFEEPEPRPPRAVVPFREKPAGTAKIWTERRFGECAFPVSGDGADVMSCCAPCVETYCATHQARMFVPATVKRRSSANELMRSLRRYV